MRAGIEKAYAAKQNDSDLVKIKVIFFIYHYRLQGVLLKAKGKKLIFWEC
jgi:hypothetical protein